MAKKNRLCIGKQLNYLKSLTDAEKEDFDKNCELIKIKKDEVVFFEKERLNQLYAICEGACKYTFIDDKGKVHITKILGNGNIMGRSSIIANKGALFTATAITDTLIYSFDKKIFLKNIEDNKKFCQDVFKGFVLDTEDEIEKIIYFQNSRTIKIRLAGLLLYLSKKFGTENSGWLKVVLKRKDMANILGTTSEYIVSLLTNFKKKNLLNLNKGRIKINSNSELLIFFDSK